MPFLNGVMRRRSDDAADDLLSRAREFFFERKRGFVAFSWPGDAALERAAAKAGMFPVVERYPEMVCTKKLDAPDGEVHAVVSVAVARAYWDICEGAYASLGFPPGVFAEAFTPEDLLGDGVWPCLATDDGHPVACASAWMTPGVGMIGWVAALPKARSKGMAAACTVTATNEPIARRLAGLRLEKLLELGAVARELSFEHHAQERLGDAHRPARLATGAKPQQRSSRPRLEGDASVDRQGALDHMQGEDTILLELTQLPPRSRRARVRPVRDGPRAGATASQGAVVELLGGNGVRLPCGQPERVGDVGEHLAHRAVDHGLDLEVDHGAREKSM